MSYILICKDNLHTVGTISYVGLDAMGVYYPYSMRHAVMFETPEDAKHFVKTFKLSMEFRTLEIHELKSTFIEIVSEE